VVSVGSAIVVVNDSPVIALPMRFGLWRDLDLNDQGADVTELHRALASIGVYRSDVAAPVSPETFRALESIDRRLLDPPLLASSVVAIGTGDVRLQAPGVRIGTVLGNEAGISVVRSGNVLALDDGGTNVSTVAVGQEISLFDASGVEAWSGQIAGVVAEPSRTLLALMGKESLPEQVVSAQVTVAKTQESVLAAPRVAIRAQPDGRSSLVVVRDDRSIDTVEVVMGLCDADLCEVRPIDPAQPLSEDLRIVVE